MMGLAKVKLLILLGIVIPALLIILLAFFIGRYQSYDKRKLLDLNQIAQALSVYYQENGFYPYADHGKPKGLDNYLEYWPTPPPRSGVCSKDQNTYSYSQKAAGEDYQVSFCLGYTQGSLLAGLHILTPKGIK